MVDRFVVDLVGWLVGWVGVTPLWQWVAVGWLVCFQGQEQADMARRWHGAVWPRRLVCAMW